MAGIGFALGVISSAHLSLGPSIPGLHSFHVFPPALPHTWSNVAGRHYPQLWGYDSTSHLGMSKSASKVNKTLYSRIRIKQICILSSSLVSVHH